LRATAGVDQKAPTVILAHGLDKEVHAFYPTRVNMLKTVGFLPDALPTKP